MKDIFNRNKSLIALTVILHFTGGVENPFIFFYFFHLSIASALLSQKETYIHTSIAVFLFLLLVYSTYFEIVPYHALYTNEDYVDIMLYKNSYYVIKNTVSFIATHFIRDLLKLTKLRMSGSMKGSKFIFTLLKKGQPI